MLRNHKECSLPEEALAIIRYHSFYPWHVSGDYVHLCDDHDLDLLTWVKEFKYVHQNRVFSAATSRATAGPGETFAWGPSEEENFEF